MKISVLVVNLNNLDFTKDCINDLLLQDVEARITLVDQGSTEPGTLEYLSVLSETTSIDIFRNNENLPLNHLWNWFVENSHTPFICLLNNDVRIPPNFLSSALKVFEKEPKVGFVNHTTNSLEFSEWDDNLNYVVMDNPYRQGWDPIFRKSSYFPIPESLKFFYGDDFIYSKLYENGEKGAYVLNSPILHFERSTTIEKGGRRDCSEDHDSFIKLDLKINNLDFVGSYSKWKPEFYKIRMKNKYLKESYITRDANLDKWETHLNSIILKQYENVLVGNVADFGCNHGSCTIIAARNEKIDSIIGIDLNKEALDVAKNLLIDCKEEKSVKKKVKFSFGELNNLNRISNDQFDSAFCFHTLEHIYPEDYDQVFSEWKRVIKSGGHFIVSVPYLKAYDDPCHVNYFDESILQNLFLQYGFEVIECYRDQRDGFDCLNIVTLVKKEKIDLSIIICSLIERKNEFLDRLLTNLNGQVLNKKNVEIIVLTDNAKRSIGKKRNDGLSLAQGNYVCFIDDDDIVSDDYVDLILKEIRLWNPDVIVFDAQITFDGLRPKLVRYGREYDHTENPEAYYRRPNHLMVHKKENIHEFFMDVKTGEDDEWASRMLDRIVTQSRINKPLYFYDYRTTTKKYFE
jgi:ubiquinone/menaquinone biosynthesis C-methylase UbiE/GT2 family glycosyltransferase